MEIIDQKLEEIKQAGNYAISLFYGEDIGCDDLDVHEDERTIKIIATPVGVLGSVRTLFHENKKTLKEFDVNSSPKIVSNPPNREDINMDSTHGDLKMGLKSIYQDLNMPIILLLELKVL